MNNLVLQETSIVVNSCDSYCDVWEMFFTSLKDNLRGVDFDIYLNTESVQYSYVPLKIKMPFKDGNHLNMAWGERLKRTLGQVDKEFVVMLFDDFILESPVNIQKISNAIQEMKKNPNIVVFYFNHIPGVNKDDGLYEGFEKVGDRNDYRLNSAPAIWRRSKLIEFTGDIDSPWAWEVFGSIRTFSRNEQFYCAKKDCEDTFVYNYTLGGAIRRGKWVESVVKPISQKYGLKIDFTKRGFAPESLSEGKYSLSWKIKFMWLGFRMVGLKSLIFFYRAVKSKILRKLKLSLT